MTFPKSLRIAVVSSVIRLNKTEDGEYAIIDGTEEKLIDICAQALNFSYKLLPSPDGAWGNLIDGKWSGGIGMVYRNEADIAISKFGVSELRRSYVDYSYPYILEDLTFAIQKPGLKSPIDALIYPFTSKLWLAVTAMIASISIIFALFHNISFVKSTQQVLGILISQAVKPKNENLRDKFLVIAWILGSMILSYSYVAVLLSFLTVPLMEKGVENIEELSAAVATGTHKAMTFRGTIHLADLLESKREAVQVIAKHIERNDYLIEFDRELVIETMRKGKVAIIGSESTLMFFAQNEIFVSRDSFKSQSSAIVISKSFCCKNEIDNFVHLLFASGMYTKHLRDEIFVTGLKSKSLESSDPIQNQARSLSLSDISGAFVLIIMGHTLALIVFFCEIVLLKKYSNHRKCKLVKKGKAQ